MNGTCNAGGIPTPPPPPPCTLTLNKTVIEAGKEASVGLSWAPAPIDDVNLQRGEGGGRGTRLTVPIGATSFEDIFTPPVSPEGRIGYLRYTMRYSALRRDNNRRDMHVCEASLRVVPTLTECNDGVDNGDAEDGVSDARDPGCHTDGDPTNSRSYDSSDTSEANQPPDLIPSITAIPRAKARRPVKVYAFAENLSQTYAGTNALVYGWRDTSASAKPPKCGKNNRKCFVQAGKTYLKLNTHNRAYKGKQKRGAPVRSFTPQQAGRYEVCAVVDYNNVILEGTTGERNNSTCVPAIVDENTEVIATPTISGPIALSVDPVRVRRGNVSMVSWDTGGRTQCVITGTNDHEIDLTDTLTATGSEGTPDIEFETTYTMVCADDGATAQATVKLLPQIQEI
jgi:hypothetical protein